MTPQRAKGRPVFDPAALDDDLDDMWPARQAAGDDRDGRLPKAAAQARTPFAPSLVPALTESAPEPETTAEPTHATQSLRADEATLGQQPSTKSRPAAADKRAGEIDHRRGAAASGATQNQTRYRPPEVLLSAEVYDALYQLQIAEKKSRRGLARPMGAIVLDAIEKHADRLMTTWEAAEDTVGEGGLFVRPSSSAVPRRRRHAVAPRTVVLSGVNAPNGRRLDALVEEWGAGTRSALVEQALRYEFALT